MSAAMTAVALSVSHRSNKIDTPGEAIFAMVVIVAIGVAGLIAVFWGLRRHRLRTIIENVATSKIRSMAMGLVELQGRAFRLEPLNSPLMGVPCAYFDLHVEREKVTETKNGTRRSWITVKRWSSREPFYLYDDTGCVLVDPSDAEIALHTQAQEYLGSSGNGEPRALAFAASYPDIIRAGLLYGFAHKYRITEQVLTIGAPTYALGTAQRRKSDPPPPGLPGPCQGNVVVAKGPNEPILFLSEGDERAAVKSLGWQALGGMVFGSAVFLGMVWVLSHVGPQWWALATGAVNG